MTQTADYFRTTNSVNADEFPLVLLEINHPDLPSPVRVVNDTDDFLHNGNTFQAVPFSFQFPSRPEQGAASAVLTIDNVGRVLTDWLETSRGGTGATATITQVLRSDPDFAQFETTMQLSNITMTNESVTARLSYMDVFNMPGTVITYSPAVTPGLF